MRDTIVTTHIITADTFSTYTPKSIVKVSKLNHCHKTSWIIVPVDKTLTSMETEHAAAIVIHTHVMI